MSLLSLMRNPEYQEQIGSGIPIEGSKGIADMFHQMYQSGTSSAAFDYDYATGEAFALSSMRLRSRGNGMRSHSAMRGFSMKVESKEALQVQVVDLLQQWVLNHDRHLIKEAIDLIHENNLTGFGHLGRNFVYYPYFLYLYLQVHQSQNIPIDDDDLGAMFARCVESVTSHQLESTHKPWLDDPTFTQESLQHLLEYKGDRTLHIKLITKSINRLLYVHIHSHGVCDPHYDQQVSKYEYPDVVAKQRQGQYTGYRDAYHLLLYAGPTHLQSLILRWDLWGEDCTADAARDYFELPADAPLPVIVARINELTSSRTQ